MTANSSFQDDSLGWQFQKLGQRVQEWVEFQFQSLNIPQVEADPWVLPDWVGRTIFWVLVIGVVSWLAWQIYGMLRPYASDWRSPLSMNRQPSSGQHQRRSPQDWWQVAQDFRQQGRYGEACLALYRGMLQQFHDTGQIPKKDSYTDGEYWRLMRNTVRSVDCRVLLDAHEQTVFGDMQASDALVNRCQEAYRNITASHQQETRNTSRT